MSRQRVLLLAMATLVVMGGIGLYFIPTVRGVASSTFLQGKFPLLKQILFGSAVGLSISILGWQIIMTPFLGSVRTFFTNIIGGIRLNIFQIIFVSLCAGIGEELLFRGTIQPLLGIWVTSIVFVFIHGYLNPFNRPLFVYGIFMTLSIAFIGYITEMVGIAASMAAHTMVDIVLLYKLTYPANK